LIGAVSTQFLADVVGWVLLTAGVDKALRPSRFIEQLASLPGVRRLARPIAWAVCAGEVCAGIALLVGLALAVAAIIAAALLTVFSAVLGYRLLVGDADACGCGGLATLAEDGRAHLVANGLLLMAATFVALAASGVGAELPAIGRAIAATSALALLLSLHVGRAIQMVLRARRNVDKSFMRM